MIDEVFDVAFEVAKTVVIDVPIGIIKGVGNLALDAIIPGRAEERRRRKEEFDRRWEENERRAREQVDYEEALRREREYRDW